VEASLPAQPGGAFRDSTAGSAALGKGQAHRIGGIRTKKETVTKALEDFIRTRRKRETVKLFGTVDFRKGWGYRKDRRGARAP